jgi:FKBP-type peptidyl-prolyl cis-trans isomerase FklB
MMNGKEIQDTLAALQAESRQKAAEAMSNRAEENKKTGEAFLAGNKKKDGVVTLPSGLQYKVLKPGDGKKPTDADTVVCHYRGMLLNGNKFGNTHRAGNPATFSLARTIPGWKEALKLMPVGSKWQVFCPPQLAYGSRGSGHVIAPNSTLVFEVELEAIKTPDAAQSGGTASAPPKAGSAGRR